MAASGDELADCLRALAASGDDWLAVWESEDGRFQVSDPTGSIAAIVIDEHWVEVRAGRPLDAAGRSLTAGVAPHSLIRVVVSDGTPATVTVCGRVYRDGFSVHALMLTARDVLALAGPLPLGQPAEEQSRAAEQRPIALPAPDDAGPVNDHPSALVTDGDEAVPEAPHPADGTAPAQTRAAPSVEAAVTPEAEALPAEVDAAGPHAGQPSGGASPPEMDATSQIRGTPITPSWTSSVGATVQIPRQQMLEATPSAGETEAAGGGASRLTCRRCGDDVQPGERFCINCGAPQPAMSAPIEPTVPRRTEPDTVVWRRPPPGAVSCPRCGGANPETNRFCQTCGTTLRGE